MKQFSRYKSFQDRSKKWYKFEMSEKVCETAARRINLDFLFHFKKEISSRKKTRTVIKWVKIVKSVSGGNSGWGNPSGFAYFLQLVIPRRRLVWGQIQKELVKNHGICYNGISWMKLSNLGMWFDVGIGVIVSVKWFQKERSISKDTQMRILSSNFYFTSNRNTPAIQIPLKIERLKVKGIFRWNV